MYPTVDVKYTSGNEETIDYQVEVYDIIKDNEESEWEIIKYNDFADIDDSLLKKLDLDELEDLVKGLVEKGEKYKVYYLHDTRTASLDDFKDRFRGYYFSEEEYTREYWEETGKLDKILPHLPNQNENYIDWQYATKEMFNEVVFSLEYDNGVLVFEM